MHAAGHHHSTKPDASGTVIGATIFTILALLGLGGTITSAIHIYDLYVASNIEWLIIWSCFGVFMLAWFAYFTKELYQLVKGNR